MINKEEIDYLSANSKVAEALSDFFVQEISNVSNLETKIKDILEEKKTASSQITSKTNGYTIKITKSNEPDENINRMSPLEKFLSLHINNNSLSSSEPIKINYAPPVGNRLQAL